MTQEAEVDGGALLRLPIDGMDWTEDLPPVPCGPAVTVSLRSPDNLRDRAALASLGYRVVRSRSVAAGSGMAEFLVPATLPVRHPQWWRALAALAVQAFDLSCGPVQAALSDIVEVHRSSGQAEGARWGSGASSLHAFE